MPNAAARPSSRRVCPAMRGRQIAASSTAARATRRNAVAAGPSSSNSDFAIAAPVWVDAIPTTTNAGAGMRRALSSRAGGELLAGNDRDDPPAPAMLELDRAGAGRVDRVVPADAHALA